LTLDDVGDVIAERKLSVVGNPSLTGIVRMGRPQPLPGAVGDDSFCPIQIVGIGSERVTYAAGVDTFQAIQLAMKKISLELFTLRRDYGYECRWEGDDSGSGFPPID
jgi:hypothetical protein